MVDLAGADAVAVLTRAPSAGGKTRLFAALGRPCDPGLLTALLLDTIEGVMMPEVRVAVAVTPAEARDEIARLLFRLKPETTDADLRNVLVIEQPEGDLGERMRGIMGRLLGAGARAVALVGSDLPSITNRPVRAAFDRLAHDRDLIVLGPALDGGYYLVAATRVPPLFDRIAWGSSDVLDQTSAAAAAAGMRVHFLESLGDVDTIDDLRRVPGSSRTAKWMRQNGLADLP